MADHRTRPPATYREEADPTFQAAPEHVTYAERLPAVIRRVSWGAIFGGAVLALMVQLALNMLGLAIGLGAVDPATDANPLAGIGWAAGIWLVVSTLIALFTGGWAAGRLAGMSERKDGVLHGLLSWSLVALFSFWLVISGVGYVLGGAMNVVQQGAQLLGQGVTAVAPEAADALGRQVEGEISASQIEREVREILRQTGQDELQPENLAERARQAAETAESAAADAVMTPDDAAQDIENAIDRLIQQGREVVSQVDREAAVNVLVERTDMSRAEARTTVAQYEDAISQARSRLARATENLGETAVETTGQVMDSTSRAAWWAFITMIIGAASAAAGGAAGTPPVRAPVRG